MKYYEVFNENGFHSAFMTTFAFSAQAFEGIPLPKLRRSGCRNIAVLADKAMLNLNLAEYGAPSYAGALYHVAKVSVGGAFHPKITLLIGAKKGRLLIGSANLTALGLAGNKELVSDIRYSELETGSAPIFSEAINYLRRYVPAGDSWFSSALGRALRHAPWLRDLVDADIASSSPDLRFLADKPDQPILDQIESAVVGDKIEKLIVMSPYWDDKLQGLSQLRAVLGKPPTDILIDTRAAQFPIAALNGEKAVKLFDLADESSARFIHAKLFIAIGEKWDHVIVGSMNCSLPALLGPILPLGNAEVGIYKRVVRGTALNKLNLDRYRLAPLSRNDVPERTPHSSSEGASALNDGGSFELKEQRLLWIPPLTWASEPMALKLFDRKGVESDEQLLIGASQKYSWDLSTQDIRPRTATVVFEDGSCSVPTIVVDLDALNVSTLPRHSGKRSRIANALDSLSSEDLFIMEAIVDLEKLDIEDEVDRKRSIGNAQVFDTRVKDSPSVRLLTYQDFINARKNAQEATSRESNFRTKQFGGAADLVSLCLNRLIGLVAADWSKEDEKGLIRQAEIDLRQHEPSEPLEEEADDKEGERKLDLSPKAHEVRATVKKIRNAIAVFEERTQLLRSERITTAELVRLRTLLQIVLAFAQPINTAAQRSHILPLVGKGDDWPRLIGRLINQHFKASIALQLLDIEGNEDEQQRVLEYLAVAHYAVNAAVAGAEAASHVNPILKPLKQLARNVDVQIQSVTSLCKKDAHVISEINDKLNERFSSQLGLETIDCAATCPIQ